VFIWQESGAVIINLTSYGNEQQQSIYCGCRPWVVCLPIYLPLLRSER